MLVAVTGTEKRRSSLVSSLFSVVDRNKTDRDVIFPGLKCQSLLGINMRQLSLFRAFQFFSKRCEWICCCKPSCTISCWRRASTFSIDASIYCSNLQLWQEINKELFWSNCFCFERRKTRRPFDQIISVARYSRSHLRHYSHFGCTDGYAANGFALRQFKF